MPNTRFHTQSKLRLFTGYYKPHMRLFIIDLICAVGIALVDLSFPLISRYSLQTLLPQGEYRFFTLLMLGLVFAFLVRSILQFIVTYWGHLLGVRMEADMRRELFGHLQTLSFRFYDKNRTGKLMSRVISDLFEIVELAHHGPEDLLISTLTLIGSFIAMLLIRWQLALILLVMIPVIVWITIRSRRNMAKASRSVKARTADINADLENSISGVRVAKAFTNEEYEIEKFDRGNNQYRDAKRGYYKAMAFFSGGMEFSTSVLNIIVIAAGAFFVVRADMTLTDMLTFILYIGTFLAPIRKLVAFFEQYTNGMAGFERFIELMKIDPDIKDKEDAHELTDVQGRIEFSEVSFSYSDDQPILEHINLNVSPGQKVALVGPSGGGKTTMCNLIPRFYEIDAGSITIDGHDIKDLTLKSLRSNVGIVQQDVFLFAASIKENIRYGRPDATDEEIMEAARKAEIHDFINELPDGYDTVVGERGAMLSGGQKQRVSIARIFLKNPPIIILDEATSALDTATEVKIQQALDELAKGRTSLIIAHRLSTIRNADMIVYIDQDGIRERGSHEELLAQGGRYKQLYDVQYRMNQSMGDLTA